MFHRLYPNLQQTSQMCFVYQWVQNIHKTVKENITLISTKFKAYSPFDSLDLGNAFYIGPFLRTGNVVYKLILKVILLKLKVYPVFLIVYW